MLFRGLGYLRFRFRSAELLVLTVSVLGACRREPHGDPPSIVTVSAASAAVASASSAASKPPAAVPPAAAKPKDPAQQRIETRQPVALDDAAKHKADAYLKALGGGRQATVKKQYEQAEALFTRCLELSPDDPRALAERGYARLRAGNLVDADADFARAQQHAPSGALLQQILHNRMLAAKQSGDDAKARQFAAAEQQKKAARRVGSGLDCTLEIKPISVQPERPSSLSDAWKRIAAAHVSGAGENPALVPDPAALSLKGNTVLAGASEAELWQRMTDGVEREGAWVVVSDDANGVTSGQHLLFAKAGHLFLRANQAFNWAGRCGPSGGSVTVAGGGTVPWHATIVDSEAYTSLLCQWPDGKTAPCYTRDDEGTPVQSYCSWTSHSEELVIYDANSFEALVSIVAEARPRDPDGGEPESLLEADFQPTKVVVRACGTTREVPYDLGTAAAPGASAAP